MIKHFRPVTTATISVLIGLIVGLGSHIAGPASARAEGAACKPAKCKSVKRFGSVIGLRPEKKDYYIKLHAETWPSVLQMIKKCNIRNYSIYMAKLQGKLYLFSYFEYTGDDLEADMKIMAADPETRRWWKETDPCQFRLPGTPDGEQWTSIPDVFHTD